MIYNCGTQPSIDGLAHPSDLVDVEILPQHDGQVLYLNVNGVTIIRLGKIQQQVEVRDEHGYDEPTIK